MIITGVRAACVRACVRTCVRACVRLTHLVIRQFVPRLRAVRKNLPQHDAETPHVRLNGERAIEDALWRHPAYGQQRLCPNLETEGERCRHIYILK